MKMSLRTVRALMAILGTMLAGVAVAMCKSAGFGVDCYQSFVTGLDIVLPFDYGTVSVLLNCVLCVFMLTMGRKYIGVTTVVNFFLLGYVIQYAQVLVESVVGVSPSFAVRVLIFAIGLPVLGISCGMYFAGDLGVSTYDCIALVVDERGWWKFKYCRITCDLTCAALGLLLGATIGAGTIIIGCLLGPMIDYFRNKWFEPFLDRYRAVEAR